MNRVIACIDSSPCINAIADAAAWVAKATGRELVLLQILDYYPASYHLGEISGVIGFESNAMLLKELAELEQKQSELALDYSNNLLRHISDLIKEKHGITCSKIHAWSSAGGNMLSSYCQLRLTPLSDSSSVPVKRNAVGVSKSGNVFLVIQGPQQLQLERSG